VILDGGPGNGTGDLVASIQHDDVVELRLAEPTLHTRVIAELQEHLRAARAQGLAVVLSSSHPSIFIAGGNLGEIARLDASSCVGYAREGRRLLETVGGHPCPVVAAVDGACAGGGTDLALACDRIVAGPRAFLAHPGARRGLITGWGGTVMLPVRVARADCRRVLLEGSRIGAAELVSCGLATRISDDPLLGAVVEARRLAGIHSGRLQLWRTLRHGRFVDRFRAVVVHNQGRPSGFSFAVRMS
jgi:enoyl-CoA hydratase/carnithine racemase